MAYHYILQLTKKSLDHPVKVFLKDAITLKKSFFLMGYFSSSFSDKLTRGELNIKFDNGNVFVLVPTCYLSQIIQNPLCVFYFVELAVRIVYIFRLAGKILTNF